jgi:hypothetical protein
LRWQHWVSWLIAIGHRFHVPLPNFFFQIADCREGGRGGLPLSPHKTKCMRFSVSPSRRSVKGVTINGVTYEGVAEFVYLGTLISNDNSVEKETQKRILAGSRT